MKLLTQLLIAAATSQALAKPHQHGQRHGRHAAKREASPAEALVAAAVVTETAYILNGRIISEHDVHEGIKNGTLEWGPDGGLSSSAVLQVAAPTAVPVLEHKPEALAQKQEAAQVEQAHTPAVADSPSPSTSPSTKESEPSQPSGGHGDCPDCDKEFPNGELSCDKFPKGYGAVPIGHESLGGWSGVQIAGTVSGAGMNDIKTQTKNTCANGPCCVPGAFCSYACPNPYLKMSWPKLQGETGQSVGGLKCNNDGKLEMADGSIAKTLCGKAGSGTTVKVENKLSQSVSICRTDYPGTESETMPFTLKPGETGELASPNLSKYYQWQGKATSAHYYINPQGVPEKEACTWSDESRAVGNWAPVIFGTSFDDLKPGQERYGYSGIKQNELRMTDKLNFAITFTGEGIRSPCTWDNKKNVFCEGKDCGEFKGCTVSLADTN
ncbi:hypothetical protein BDV95DRAFT_652392 [Massariosphaeria phaeospora]|uniref:SUN domain-containing protein n=1 Tax=Massariosphaeria phaeospora TaxID=100035 RepID=A0A7C8M4L3_9PLEO|nr:hypothetical protein BDV95DRAFT_652392 [Massariosphaeria phaeospora]